MKKRTQLILQAAFILLSSSIFAQFQSSYLNNPDLAKDVVLNEADFWSQYKDETYGGYFNEVSSTGSASTEAQKSFCSQSRLAYGFTRAFMLTGDTDYLEDARYAMNFVYDYAWDDTYGGWYYAANRDGSSPTHNTYHNNKWSFIQHYAMVGSAALNEASDGTINWNDGHESDKTWLFRGLNSLYSNLWDATSGIEGFYAQANNDWSSPSGKGFTPTVDAMTTHATVMALREKGSTYYNSYFHLADKLANKIIQPNFYGDHVIYEELNSDWSVGGYTGEEYYGHDLKCAWNLCRAYLIDPSKTEYKNRALSLLDEILTRDYVDPVYGGVYYRTGNTNKSHWTQEQGVLAGMLAATITDDETKKQSYLELADNCWKFAEDQIVDFTNGGSYLEVNQSGDQKYAKGDYWEAGYHMAELAYYTYLYGNIYLNNESVELFYNFEAQTTAQVQKLTPLSIADDKLIIEEVTLNGVAFSNYNANSRELNIAANEGGVFKVKFRYNGSNCPALSLGTDQSICDNSPINLNTALAANGDYTFTWYKDGALISGPSTAANMLSVSDAGTYSVTAENANCSISDEIVITDNIPIVNLGNDFTLSGTASLTTGLSGKTHTWFKNGTQISGISSESLSISEAGTYQVSVDNGYCPASTDEIVVSAPDLAPIAFAGDDFTIALPQTSFTLDGSANGGDAPLSYQWTTNSSANISNAHSLTPNISISSSGSYAFTLIVTDSDGDQASDIVNVSVLDAIISVTGVNISSNISELIVGETAQLTANLLPADATNQNVSWTTSNASVITVDAYGSINATGIGNATITVTTEDGNYTDQINITVQPIAVTGVVIDQSDLSLEEGQTEQLSATVLPANASNLSVSWSSDAASIASVSSNGLIEAIAEGTATIHVATIDGNYTASINVTVTAQSITNCIDYTVPTASDWIIVNNWNDGSAGCTFTNTSEALVYNHRAWGNNYAYLIQTGQPMKIKAGESYTVSLDVFDEDTRLSGMQIGFCTGNSWDRPSGIVAPMTDLPSGFSSSAYTNKTATVTATGSSDNAYLVVYIDMSTQMIAQNYYFKNVSVCGTSSLKAFFADYSSDYENNQTASYSVYPVPATDYLTVKTEFSADAQPVTLINILGEIVYSGTISGSTLTIDTRNLQAGTYLLNIGSDQQTVSIIK